METKFDPHRTPEQLLDMAVHFHGHLGSYLVVGLRLGYFGLRIMDLPGYFGLWVRSYTMQQPPQSCMTDGLQVSTGCTLGKGNISCSGEGLSQASFYTDSKLLTLRLHPDIEAQIKQSNSEEADEALAMKLLKDYKDEDLFIAVDVTTE